MEIQLPNFGNPVNAPPLIVGQPTANEVARISMYVHNVKKRKAEYPDLLTDEVLTQSLIHEQQVRRARFYL